MNTFSDLPDALVRDLLHLSTPVANQVKSKLKKLYDQKSTLRNTASHLLARKADLDVPREPSVVGIDGSYQLHHLTSLDLCACAAIAVEGTVKEHRNRHWPEPYHRVWAGCIPHDENTTSILRASMVSRELELASLAPHDLILLDGSFSSFVIYINQGLSSIRSSSQTDIAIDLINRWDSGTMYQQLIEILISDRVAAIPKFTSRIELIKKIGLQLEQETDDKTIATLILEPGEYTKPISLFHEEPYHLGRSNKQQNIELNRVMDDLKVIYFRPYGWLPALRIELPSSSANSPLKLSLILKGIESQLFTPSVLEPYPLFLADRMVKS